MPNYSDDQRSSAARVIQRHVRGYLSRQRINIRRAAPGVVHIKINGDEALFARLHIVIDRGRGDRKLHVLSIDPGQYSSHAVGGDKEFNPVASSKGDRQSILGNSTHNIFINGAFFNAGQRYAEHPSHTPIGQTRTPHALTEIPAPAAYLDCFDKFVCSDGSYLSAAPILTASGKNQFPASNLKQERFNYASVRSGKVGLNPGDLYHSSDPNPRSGVAYPSTNAPSLHDGTRIRLVAAIATTRGENSDGLTMPEFANIMTRLSMVNGTSGCALNLDGGGSVAMGITDHEGNHTFLISQDKGGRSSSTMLAFRFIL